MIGKSSTSPSILPTAVLLLALWPTASLRASDWPQWRGADQTMVSLGNGIFDASDDGEMALEVVWKRPLGPAYSSISIMDGRAVTMFSDDVDDFLIALDAATGQEIWRYRIAATYKGHSAAEPGPRGTPTIHDGVVYALGPYGHLFAVRFTDGSLIWSRDITSDQGAKAPMYGFSTAPILVDGVLVVETGAPVGGAVSGFDPTNGERLWSTGSDTVGHQSPLDVTLEGERQVLAVTSHFLMGIAPKTGEQLWQFRHTSQPGMEGGWTQPLLIDGDKVLISYWDASPLHRVSKNGDGWSISEVWRSRDLKVNSLMPIYYDGYLYGFNQRFLTCIDPKTGKSVWKSRPPGYGGLALIDGHLVVIGPKGVVSVVEATPEGYREKASLPVFTRHSLAPASAGRVPLGGSKGGRDSGLIFARDMNEIAALRAVRKVAPERLATASPDGVFGRFLKHVNEAGDKAAVIAEFLADHSDGPLVEGDDLVHFIYTGTADDAGRPAGVGLTGNMFDVGDEVSLERVDGTSFYYKTLQLEPAGLWEYAFVVGYKDTFPDARNPRRVETPRGTRSLVATPGYEDNVESCSHCPQGRLESLKVKKGEDERELQIYLPAGYDEGEERYPLLLVTQGDHALRYGRMREILDSVIRKEVAPIVVAFVPGSRRGQYSGSRFERYAGLVIDEILPRLPEKYRLLERASNVGVMGTAGAAMVTADLASRRPDIFGKVAVQSYVHLGMGEKSGPGEKILARLAQAETKSVIWYVDWRRRDLKSEPGLEQAGFWTRDATRDSRRLAQVLEKNGYEVEAVELPGGAGWSTWRARTAHVLKLLFPR